MMFLCPSPLFGSPGRRCCNTDEERRADPESFWTAEDRRRIGVEWMGGSGVLLRIRMGGKSEISLDNSF
jgi:hypothetical protein